MRNLSRKLWGSEPVTSTWAWKKNLSLEPRTFLSGKHVYSISGIDISSKAQEEIDRHYNGLFNCIKNLPSQPYRIVLINRSGNAKVCPPRHHPDKAEFVKKYERFINENWNVRKRNIYFIFDTDDEVKNQLASAGLNPEEDRPALMGDLSCFFGGDGVTPFFHPIEKWEHGVKIGPYYGACLMNLGAVGTTEPFHMHVLNYIHYDYIFVTAFDYPTLFETESKLSRLQSGMGAKVSQAAKEVEAELTNMLTDLSLGRERLIYSTSTLTVFATSEETALQRAKEVSYMLRNNGLTYELERTVEFEAFFNLFHYDVKRAKNMGLVRRYPSKVFTCLLPFSKEFAGATSGALFLNGAMEPVYMDPMRTSSPHSSVLGATGSGKSLFSQYLGLYSDILVAIEKIQDAEGSYKVFTQYFKGQYAPISLDRPLSVNPFGESLDMVDRIRFLEDIGYKYSDFSDPDIITLTDFMEIVCRDQEQKILPRVEKDHLIGEMEKYPGTDYLAFKLKDAEWPQDRWEVKTTTDKEKLWFLVTLLQAMISDENHPIAPEDVSLLEQAVLNAYRNKKRRRKLGTSEIASELKEIGRADLSNRLRSFTSSGRYGSFFDEPCDLLDGDVFYELRINDNEVLVPVILSILNITLKGLSHPRHFGKSKKVLLDESWFFMKYPLLADLVDEMLRTYRKKGIEVALASQMASDFSEGGGKIVRAQCEHNLFLFNKPETLPVIKDSFQLNDAELNLLRGLRPPKEYGYKYSRLFAQATYGKGTLLFIPSPELYWIATTDAADRIKREKAKAETKDMGKAIRLLAARK